MLLRGSVVHCQLAVRILRSSGQTWSDKWLPVSRVKGPVVPSHRSVHCFPYLPLTNAGSLCCSARLESVIGM